MYYFTFSKKLKKKHFLSFIFFISLLNFTYAQKKKSYVKFDNNPEMILSRRNKQFDHFKIEYFTKKSATIYLELVDKYDKVVGNAIVELKGRNKGTKDLSIKLFPESKIRPSSHYKYRLSMYHAPMHVWENLVSNEEVVGVKVTSKI